MKVTVVSRREIEGNPSRYSRELNEALKEENIIVSIYTPEDSPPVLPSSSTNKSVLQIAFMDLDKVITANDGSILNPMSFSQAVEIKDFVQKHATENTNIIVHCDAGVSRSRGVAAALCVVYGLNDEEHYRLGCPNAHVKRLLLRAFRNLEED